MRLPTRRRPRTVLAFEERDGGNGGAEEEGAGDAEMLEGLADDAR